MRDFLAKFASDLTSPYSEQLKADLQRLVDRVNSHKFEFLAKLNELSPPNQTMTEFEKATMEPQRQQLELQQKLFVARKSW